MPNVSTPPQSANDGHTTYDKFKDWLYTVEQSVGKKLGIDDTMSYASRRPGELGYPTNDDSGMGKSLRHLLLAAELTRTHPTLASTVLNGHEYVTNVLQNQPADTRARDLFNNRLGQQIGMQAKSREDVERMAIQALSKAQNTNEQQVGFNQAAPK